MGRNFKTIKAWQYADNLTVNIYSKTKKFPSEELYGLTSQLRRSAISVPTNIAEGSNREHKREFLHFLYIARGSLSEVEYLLYLAMRLTYLNSKDYDELEQSRIETASTLNGFINLVKKESSLLSRTSALVTSTIVLLLSRLIT